MIRPLIWCAILAVFTLDVYASAEIVHRRALLQQRLQRHWQPRSDLFLCEADGPCSILTDDQVPPPKPSCVESPGVRCT